jgi:carbonic anhydrase
LGTSDAASSEIGAFVLRAANHGCARAAGLIGMVLAGGAAMVMRPQLVMSASGEYEAMILACIDPRVQEAVHVYAQQQGLIGKYSQFVFAGAAIGAVAPSFKDWHKAFWDNLGVSVQLHKIKRIIAIDHRDCGAAKIAYGDAKVANPEIETETHKAALAEFRAEVKKHQPTLAVETGLMALDGSIQIFT